ncbi:hypothetical protein K4F52_000366 [Lecanicillium sp. MT-2017a]|nr:hypothetical protein K4F52_000366 [Lecanicillium sp. MT-2017a]
MPPSKSDVESPSDEYVSAVHRESNSNSDGNDTRGFNEKDGRRASTAALLRNPLTGMSKEDVLKDVDSFVDEKGLSEFREDFRKGALVAQVGNIEDAFETIEGLTEEEKGVLRLEKSHRWKQPFTLYFLCTLCAGSAIVQGMDQTAVNGAQVFYYDEFNIRDPMLQGLMNGAPFANLLVARFFLGFAVGAKSSTTPVYAAESAPKTIRGALTMMWQMWTAFGICLGFVASVAFQYTDFLGENSQWRWMLGSTAIPPFFVMIQVYFCPESPRWYMEKGRYENAYNSMRRLRNHTIQAARDMYYAHKFLEVERKEREGRNLLKEFFMVRRNRRAAQSSWFVMFMQQFCGVNVIAYYSTSIYMDANFSRSNALLVSMGGGIINWLFAIPAIYTIDTFGRRNLLLVTFPLMSICLFFTGFIFNLPDGTPKLACVTLGLYLFMVVYSPGEGPVPFTYSAEAYPLHIRDIGMASSTAITWGFNFIISLTWPKLVEAFGNTGAFCWYAAWNIFGWVFAYFFLPETKSLTLEELDTVFSMRNREHGGYYLRKLPWYAKKYTGCDVDHFSPLYDFAGSPENYSDSPEMQQGQAPGDKQARI